jgi:hypothetical protein
LAMAGVTALPFPTREGESEGLGEKNYPESGRKGIGLGCVGAHGRAPLPSLFLQAVYVPISPLPFSPNPLPYQGRGVGGVR